MAERELTEGEYQVGISFNPSQSPIVDNLKRKAADFIDAVNAIPKAQPGSERQITQMRRCMALAITNAEDAAMWAVKAATKQP